MLYRLIFSGILSTGIGIIQLHPPWGGFFRTTNYPVPVTELFRLNVLSQLFLYQFQMQIKFCCAWLLYTLSGDIAVTF